MREAAGALCGLVMVGGLALTMQEGALCGLCTENLLWTLCEV